MTEWIVDAPAMRELKERLASISLMILGQHIWSLRITFGDKSARACLCRCCDEARKAYRDATGLWPTSEQELAAMEKWGTGK